MSHQRLLAFSLFANLAALPLFTMPALAQTAQSKTQAPKSVVSAEPAVTTATYGNWVLRCVQTPAQGAADSKNSVSQTCEVVQTVQVQGQQQPIAQVALGRLPGESDLILTALLPVNISLPGEVRLSGNGKTGAEEKGTVLLAWRRCLSGACMATAQPDATTLALIRSGTEGQIHFADANGITQSIPLSWVGLDQAITALEKVR